MNIKYKLIITYLAVALIPMIFVTALVLNNTTSAIDEHIKTIPSRDRSIDAELADEIDKVGSLAVVISVIVAILVALTSYFISKSISDPLAKLTDVSRNIAKGNLENRVDIKTEDEFGELAQSFNQMTESLQASYGELEEKVKIRTTELEKSVKELNKLNKVMTGRELKMIELKKEIKKLEDRQS